MYENGKILYMTCNGQLIHRGRKMITHCGMARHKKYIELSKKKGSRSCATISQVLGNINTDIDYGGVFSDNVKRFVEDE